jgi:hypothetical protein
MSATVKLSSKLPGDVEVNGLDAYAEHLNEVDHEMLVAIVYIDSPKGSIDKEQGGIEVPTARIRRIEPLGTIGDVPQAVRDAMAEAEQARTGRKPLPFETVEVGEHRHSDTLDDE